MDENKRCGYVLDGKIRKIGCELCDSLPVRKGCEKCDDCAVHPVILAADGLKHVLCKVHQDKYVALGSNASWFNQDSEVDYDDE
jgi:hypothetical protein